MKCGGQQLAIDVFPVADIKDYNFLFGIVYGIDDPVISCSNAVKAAAAQFFAINGPRVQRKAEYFIKEMILKILREFRKEFFSAAGDLCLIAHFFRFLSRVSTTFWNGLVFSLRRLLATAISMISSLNDSILSIFTIKESRAGLGIFTNAFRKTSAVASDGLILSTSPKTNDSILINTKSSSVKCGPKRDDRYIEGVGAGTSAKGQGSSQTISNICLTIPLTLYPWF